MGMIIKGMWSEDENLVEHGAYIRPTSIYNAPIGKDTIDQIYAHPKRYLLIASNSCQWSHRCLMTHSLKELSSHIPVHIAYGPRLEGYAINGGDPWKVPNTDKTIQHLHQLYSLSEASYTGRSTIPILWDSKEHKIISNESKEILRGFNLLGSKLNPRSIDLYPEEKHTEIDELNSIIHQKLSNGVYRAGFAETQSAYDEAVQDVFGMLSELENRLAGQNYLFGNQICESDLNLFSTLVRFDAVYYVLHKCSYRRLIDYPFLWRYARKIYQIPAIKNTVHFEQIRQASYENDTKGNPFGITAIAPEYLWDNAA